jgi:hypothetical protein
MADLYPGYTALRLHKCGNLRHAFDLRVGPEAGAAVGDTALSANCCGLYDHKPRATSGTSAQMLQMPVVDKTIDCGILAHR